MKRAPLHLAITALVLAGMLTASSAPAPEPLAPAQAERTVSAGRGADERLLHEQAVMKSLFCAGCHPAIYAEHERSTHGRAFTDEEVRLATGRFDHGDCIICHTPRPIFETGIGMNPMRRHYGLEEGNTCMTCHWRQGYDYGTFAGGAECVGAFDPRVGEVEACASCHRNHGTPFQWATSPLGKGNDRMCIDCHMRRVTRPVAVGEEPRRVSSHGFPGSRNEAHLRRAYTWEARVEGNEVVITIENDGAGHNFPTELKQRSLESLVVIKDLAGREVARSRMVFRDPYKRPYGLHLPVNTQIPSGQGVEHRVPIQLADGTVECELHFKLYFPVEDHHPELARRLEVKKIPFNDIEPSTKPVLSAPTVAVVTPESITVAAASPANLVDFARPAIDAVAVDVPEGDTPADVARLIELFQFPVPAANRAAQARLVEIGTPAIGPLIAALGSWDNKTWNQAESVLVRLGASAVPALVDALGSDELYVRIHARDALVRQGASAVPGLTETLARALGAQNALDRASAAAALGDLGLAGGGDALVRALADRDPDVVRAAALALARLGRADAVPAIRAALPRFLYQETRRDLSRALAHLGAHDAVPLLMDGLDHHDDLLREDAFEALFAVTGLHLGYEPLAPRPERLDAIASLRAFWAKRGADVELRPLGPAADSARAEELWGVLGKLGDGGDDEPLRQRLLDAGSEAVPALVKALKYPAGFDVKRRQVCELLGRIGHPDGVPALIATLSDPVIGVAAWACWALEAIGDVEALHAVQRYESRLHTLAAAGAVPPEAGSVDALLAQATRTRITLGEEAALHDLVELLLSDDVEARRLAIDTLRESFGFDLDFDPEGPLADRRRTAAEWANALQ